MIPGYLNSFIAIVLVYLSVLRLSVLETHQWTIPVAGAIIVVLALWSRAGDMMKWFSTVNVLLGLMLVAFGVWQWLSPFAHLFVFWFVFWTGVLVGVVALWAAVYRPGSPRSRAPEALTGGDKA